MFDVRPRFFGTNHSVYDVAITDLKRWRGNGSHHTIVARQESFSEFLKAVKSGQYDDYIMED